MTGSSERIREVLEHARAARRARDIDAARAAYSRTYEQARSGGDAAAMCEAALGLAGIHAYGMHAGRLPAYLFEAYSVSDGPARVRLAAAIARTWAYGNDPTRGAPFADEAVAAAEQAGDQALLAEALDAQLLMHWGPDDFADRLRIASRLEDAAAYVTDTEARMSAHLWRLTTAVEALDAPGLRRQLSALQRLADETGSPRVRFFERSRQAMHALVLGDLDAARAFRTESIAAGVEAQEADVLAVEHVLGGEIARQSGDVDALLFEAAAHEQFGVSEGVPAVLSEAASLWLDAGEPDRARELLLQVAGAGFDALPRELDWLMAMTQLTRVAAAIGERDLTQDGLRLLAPYAGRGIPNGGAVTFSGVVDAYLAHAAAALGQDEDAARWSASGAALAERFNCARWAELARDAVGRRGGAAAYASAAPITAVLRPQPGGVWTVGTDAANSHLREMKGLAYLRLLVRQPGVEIAALDLSDWAAGHPGSGLGGVAAEPVIDRQALSAYRGRLSEIDRELAEAQEWVDAGRVDLLRDERDALLAEVRAATGLGGRTRTAPGGAAERARVAVRKAVAAAIGRITELDPVLGRVLTDTVRTGAFCCYEPDPTRPVVWRTE